MAKAKKTTKKTTAKKAVKTTKKAAAPKAAAKKATKKAAAPKATTKKAATPKTATKRKPNAAFMKPLTPSTELSAVIGEKQIARTEVMKRIWAYIKKHNLQDAVNRRNINADDKLKAVFGGKKTVNMFEMTKLINKHLS